MRKYAKLKTILYILNTHLKEKGGRNLVVFPSGMDGTGETEVTEVFFALQNVPVTYLDGYTMSIQYNNNFNRYNCMNYTKLRKSKR